MCLKRIFNKSKPVAISLCLLLGGPNRGKDKIYREGIILELGKRRIIIIFGDNKQETYEGPNN